MKRKETGSKDIQAKNHTRKMDLLAWLLIVSYFDEAGIQLFFSGNAHFKKQAALDLKDIRKAEKKNQQEQSAWRTRDIIHLESIHEVSQDDLKSLLALRFREAQRDKGFKTLQRFASAEAADFEMRYGKHFALFPVLKQWIEFIRSSDNNVIEQQDRFNNFDDLFEDKDLLDRSLKALQNVNPPIIDSNGNYLLGKRSKGAFTAFISVLKGKIKSVNDVHLAELLNRKFKNLRISDRVLRDPGTKAFTLYQSQLAERLR